MINANIMIRTKIIATLGPASSSVKTLIELFEAGTDVCRLNFSHGSLGEHEQTLSNIRQAASHHKEPIGVLGDLCGPKIRLGAVANPEGMPIAVGDRLTMQREPITGHDLRVSTTYDRFVDDVRVGDRILIEDGLLRFLATDKLPDEIIAVCTSGGVLRSSKGINLPNTPVSIPCITEKDWQCVDWAIDHDLDYLALSFVRRAQDLRTLRSHLHQRKSPIGIIAKIEKPEAMEEIDAIIEAADGLMVARGDLGVEMDLAQVPIIQKDLIRRCQRAGKPVIVATQMLQSMIVESSPTRAEVSDVANAVVDGTDAVMLSGETSVGKYPAAAVHIMNHIADLTERYMSGIEQVGHPIVLDRALAMSSAVAAGVWELAHELAAKLVVVWSQSGATARVLSKFRFSAPVIAFSNEERALRQMALQYGVIPRRMSPPESTKDLITRVDAVVQEEGFAAQSDRIVIVAGPSMGVPGTANQVIIHTVGMENV